MPSDTLPHEPPIKGLPEDVLREIFIHCLGKSGIPKRHAPPLLLCQICKYWREIALSEPRLWTAIEISTRYNNSPQDQVTESISWMRRATTLPKDIVLRLNARSYPRMDMDQARLNLESLTGELSSCRQLTIRLSHHSFFKLYFQPQDVDATPMILESFELLCHPSDTIVDDLAPFIRTADRLSKLTLGVLPSKLAMFDSLWGQITHLNLIRVPLSEPEWLTILRKTRRLEKAAFLFHVRFYHNFTQTNGITLPYLTHLVIRFKKPIGNPVKALAGISLPALVYFKAARARDICYPSSPAFKPYPLQHLRTLCLLHVTFETRDFFDLLETATMLQALSIAGAYYGSPGYLRYLNYSEYALVPRLETFCLSDKLDAALPVLNTIATSRQSIQLSDGTYSLRHLTLSDARDPAVTHRISQESAQHIRKLKTILNVTVKPEKHLVASISAKIPWRDL